MRALSAKIAAIAPSATIQISEEARQMGRQGIDVISLSIGEPDFDTPAHIKEACIEALTCVVRHIMLRATVSRSLPQR